MFRAHEYEKSAVVDLEISVIGAPLVGKTALIRQLIDAVVEDTEYYPTKITTKYVSDEEHEVEGMFYRPVYSEIVGSLDHAVNDCAKSHAVMVLYDPAVKETFQKAKEYIEAIRKHEDYNRQLLRPIILISNQKNPELPLEVTDEDAAHIPGKSELLNFSSHPQATSVSLGSLKSRVIDLAAGFFQVQEKYEAHLARKQQRATALQLLGAVLVVITLSLALFLGIGVSTLWAAASTAGTTMVVAAQSSVGFLTSNWMSLVMNACGALGIFVTRNLSARINQAIESYKHRYSAELPLSQVSEFYRSLLLRKKLVIALKIASIFTTGAGLGTLSYGVFPVATTQVATQVAGGASVVAVTMGNVAAIALSYLLSVVKALYLFVAASSMTTAVPMMAGMLGGGVLLAIWLSYEISKRFSQASSSPSIQQAPSTRINEGHLEAPNVNKHVASIPHVPIDHRANYDVVPDMNNLSSNNNSRRGSNVKSRSNIQYFWHTARSKMFSNFFQPAPEDEKQLSARSSSDMDTWHYVGSHKKDEDDNNQGHSDFHPKQ